jgi:hypothetical protein
MVLQTYQQQSSGATIFWWGVAIMVAAFAILELWVTLARAAGAVAKRRGYPRLVGVAVGLLTGPLAIAAFALLPTRHRVHHMRA